MQKGDPFKTDSSTAAAATSEEVQRIVGHRQQQPQERKKLPLLCSRLEGVAEDIACVIFGFQDGLPAVEFM